MVPPRGFLFLRFGGNCVLKCEHWCAFGWKILQHLLSLHDAQ